MPSALYKAMGGLATNNVNLIKLESYTPDGRMVATQFHIDAEAHPNDANMILAMDELAYFARTFACSALTLPVIIVTLMLNFANQGSLIPNP